MKNDFYKPVIFGLRTDIPDIETYDVSGLIALAGGNTGNFAFNYAIQKELGQKPDIYYWGHKLKDVDGCIGIIPCANQLGQHCDMSTVFDWQKNMNMPFVGIGLGAQSSFNKDKTIKHPKIPEGTLNWVRQMASQAPTKYPNITVRGNFTMEIMESLGLGDSAIPLGCPTLFINEDCELGKKIEKRLDNPKKIVLATLFNNSKILRTIEQSLSRLVDEYSGAIVIQSHSFLIQSAIGDVFNVSKAFIENMNKFYMPQMSQVEFLCWVRKHFKIFFNIDNWIDYLKDFDMVIGPRIHGIMMAINAGIPGLCIAMDSRIMELCEIMKIPYITPDKVENGINRNQLIDLCKFDGNDFDKNRRELSRKYVEFMRNNKIEYASYLNRFAL
jgi:hypothetical protein